MSGLASPSAMPAWLPDWRDDAAYRLVDLDRPGFAWEWLRRDPAYRAASLKAKGRAWRRLWPARRDGG